MMDRTEFNLYISDVGNVVFMYKGILDHRYDWAQFDPQNNSLNFITVTGESHNLGMSVPKAMQQKLDKTKELMMIEINEDNSRNNPVFLRFIKTI